ncbi:hypothetical protein I3843_08G166600 [Carya illinoinensis]|nr:hypothetical protein I3843_08G166600 [Carya illinoinensis]
MPPPWGPPPGTPGLQGLCGCFDFPYRPCEFSFFFPLQSYKYLKESQVCVRILYVLCCCCRRLESCCGPLFGGGPGGPY